MDKSRVAELHAKYSKIVKRVINQMRVPEMHAADLRQDVWIRLLRYDAPKEVRDETAWICQIARNVAYEWLTKSRQRRVHYPIHPAAANVVDFFSARDPHDALRGLHESGLMLDDKTPEEILIAQERQDQIKAAIGRLKPRERQLLELSHAHGLTKPQSQKVMNISPRMALRLTTQSYEKLRVSLNDLRQDK